MPPAHIKRFKVLAEDLASSVFVRATSFFPAIVVPPTTSGNLPLACLCRMSPLLAAIRVEIETEHLYRAEYCLTSGFADQDRGEIIERLEEHVEHVYKHNRKRMAVRM